MRCYDGWFHAPVTGNYTFDLPARRPENTALGGLRSAYQNQLRIDGEVIVQRGVPGRMPLGQIVLKQGWHSISIRLGASPGAGSVTFPDGQKLPLTAPLLSRPSLVNIHPVGVQGGRSLYEIYGPTPVELLLPTDRRGEIRFTRDGKIPTAQDERYSKPIVIDSSVVLSACAFVDGRPTSTPATVSLRLVHEPEYDLIGSADFSHWNGKAGITSPVENSMVWIMPDSQSCPGRNGQRAISVNRQEIAEAGPPKALDVNVTHSTGHPGFKITGLRMKENALTMGCWFKSDTANGKIFGKEGRDAFGKSYKTVSCSLNHGQLHAEPAKIQAGNIDPGTWHHVVLTADENATTLYLDGDKVAEGEGCKTLATDSFDFLAEHPAVVEKVLLYNRVLSQQDIKQWFLWENSPTAN